MPTQPGLTPTKKKVTQPGLTPTLQPGLTPTAVNAPTVAPRQPGLTPTPATQPGLLGKPGALDNKTLQQGLPPELQAAIGGPTPVPEGGLQITSNAQPGLTPTPVITSSAQPGLQSTPPPTPPPVIQPGLVVESSPTLKEEEVKKGPINLDPTGSLAAASQNDPRRDDPNFNSGQQMETQRFAPGEFNGDPRANSTISAADTLAAREAAARDAARVVTPTAQPVAAVSNATTAAVDTAQQVGESDPAVRNAQKDLLQQLISESEALGQNAADQLTIPEFQNSSTTNALETLFSNQLADPTGRDVGRGAVGEQLRENFLGNLADPTGRDVGIGDVGTQLEGLLKSRLGFEGEDAIAARQRAEHEAQTGRSRDQLIEQLNRFGILGGATSAGSAADVLGNFEGQADRGLLDIAANQQLRRDADLGRAQDFAGFQSGLGLNNRSLNQNELNQALGFNQADIGRQLNNRSLNQNETAQASQFGQNLDNLNQRRGEFEFGANLDRLTAQQDVADRSLGRRMPLTAPTGDEQFQESIRQSNRGFDETQRQFNAGQQLSREELTGNIADPFNAGGPTQQSLASQGLSQQDRQFMDSLGLSQDLALGSIDGQDTLAGRQGNRDDTQFNERDPLAIAIAAQEAGVDVPGLDRLLGDQLREMLGIGARGPGEDPNPEINPGSPIQPGLTVNDLTGVQTDNFTGPDTVSPTDRRSAIDILQDPNGLGGLPADPSQGVEADILRDPDNARFLDFAQEEIDTINDPRQTVTHDNGIMDIFNRRDPLRDTSQFEGATDQVGSQANEVSSVFTGNIDPESPQFIDPNRRDPRQDLGELLPLVESGVLTMEQALQLVGDNTEGRL